MRQGIRAGVMLPGIRRQRRGERVIRYHRATGIRLPDDIPETHPDFVAAWAKAEADLLDPAARAQRRAPVRAGTIAAAIRSIRQGAEWAELSPGYRATILRATEDIAATHGTLPLAGIRRRHIEADLGELSPNPANARLKAWRMLCRVALRQGVISDDPSLAVPKRRIRTEGHTAWSDGDIAAFRSRHSLGTPTRACFELVYWTGVRTCDAVALSPAHVAADGVLTFRQSKTHGLAHVPWTCALPPWAQGWAGERAQMHESLRCLAGGFTFLAVSGRVRSVKGLGNVINDGAVAAGLTHRTAHGLRKARLTAIAEAGGSAHAIMAWGGHRSLSEAQRYTSAARTRELVRGTEQEENAVPVPGSDTIWGVTA